MQVLKHRAHAYELITLSQPAIRFFKLSRGKVQPTDDAGDERMLRRQLEQELRLGHRRRRLHDNRWLNSSRL
ncbi:hypothetical protein NZD89_16320 [Alicyclobacillus fastidiosus]|uniref:Uncharacterized protein n=1 Tax=Alicyclobacillus fastidiosus TaxID=392011 RepID=A0ABY6ZAS5_9BACL|nr:hypothetical protein NZD89_16320 [Alicyclobacillus fastidiosus]